ncbi:MAG: DUF1540 domain-containing protein [Chloroflexi bacterium]|nr:DUF1540 domain-containing protein [Chloroflexota bacterium]
MDMTRISACSMAQCTYNQDNRCHTHGIMVGPHAECSTYTYCNPKAGRAEVKGGIGACLADECKFNESLECCAPDVDVHDHSAHADCRTFQARA